MLSFISNANVDSAQLFLLRSEVGDIEKGSNFSSIIQNLLQPLKNINKNISIRLGPNKSVAEKCWWGGSIVRKIILALETIILLKIFV